MQRFERGFAPISVAESLDTGSVAGRLVLNIMTALSQWEHEAIGERTRDAMLRFRSPGSHFPNRSGHNSSPRLVTEWSIMLNAAACTGL